MLNQLKDIFRVIGSKNKVNSLKLLLLLLLIVIFELLSIGLIIPGVSLLLDIDSLASSKYFTFFKNFIFLETIDFFILLLLITIILKVVSLFFFEFKTQKYLKEISIDLLYKVYYYYLTAQWKDIIQKEHATIVRNITSDTEIFVKQGLLNYIVLFKNIITTVVISLYLFTVSFTSTVLILGLFILFLFVFIFFFKNRLVEISFKIKDATTFRFKNITETLFSLREIKLINNENYFIKLFKLNEIKIQDLNIILSLIGKAPRLILELLLVIIIAAIIYYLDRNQIQIYGYLPIITLYFYITFRLIPIFIGINNNIQAIKYSKAQIQEVIKNIRITNELSNNKSFEYNSENNKLKKDFDIESIEGEDVSFKYLENNPFIFDKANFKFNKGKLIGIEGPNGSGKSTILDLVSGLLKPDEGKILVNGKNIFDDLKSYQNKIGYVSQSIFLHNTSIKNNLLFGRKNISDQDLEEVLELTNINDFTNKLPNKLDTMVGSAGKFFSGGQKQKIGIARALLGKPKLIILDEATSALDKNAQKIFFDLVFKIKNNLIILVISHNEEVQNLCESRYVIKDKKINLIE